MNSNKVTIEVDAKHEVLMRRTLAMLEEMEQLALSAPDGTVFDTCEAAVITKGRELNAQMLGQAVARRIETAEKRGRRSASVPVAGKRKTSDRKNAT